MVTLMYEAAIGIFSPGTGGPNGEGEALSIWFVFFLICLEGICGGLA